MDTQKIVVKGKLVSIDNIFVDTKQAEIELSPEELVRQCCQGHKIKYPNTPQEEHWYLINPQPQQFSISACCNASVKLYGEGEGTQYYRCEVCGRVCELSDDFKPQKKEFDDLLLLCQRGIEDAIGCEDGLDGSVGEDIIKEINCFRKKFGLPKTQQVKDKPQQSIKSCLTCAYSFCCGQQGSDRSDCKIWKPKENPQQEGRCVKCGSIVQKEGCPVCGGKQYTQQEFCSKCGKKI